ncbi:hypothetical protein LZQ00_13375 [Sphingobacterium sp. SRCM116780]|uniref:hypothetical protein n=1 Tax=Sphingobacterium sp. SRCM116780 TaxID=2907623 RepID=UPI001F2DE177|nr:hypothetical protein [Sphingobacterium sp. SRCM116780]UIR55258.1 hypothetical protein LZQ00_13375 [Sphingobacterium sp. SRCM116780]
MAILLIFFILGLLFLLGFALIVTVVNKTNYASSINKKFNSIGYKVISISNMECPDFLKKIEEENTNFIMDFGGSPTVYIYKSIELEHQHFSQQKGIVVIKRVLFVITSIKYYLDLNNEGVYDLLE